jgi:hypothetical protein
LTPSQTEELIWFLRHTQPSASDASVADRAPLASSSKGISQPALRRHPGALVGGRKSCGLSGGLARRSWGVIARVPCSIRLVKAPKNEARFHDFDEFERLVEVARSEALAFLVVLLGGEAGLRCGEIMALEWRTSTSLSGS